MIGDTKKHSFEPDPRPALVHLGWAPGHYTSKCHKCKELFTGDKRAYTCADCAYGSEE